MKKIIKEKITDIWILVLTVLFFIYLVIGIFSYVLNIINIGKTYREIDFVKGRVYDLETFADNIRTDVDIQGYMLDNILKDKEE